MKKDNTDKKSSWGAAGVSVLKEFFLNFSGPGHLYYEENLSDEGIRKKEFIWGPILLMFAIPFAFLPLVAWNMVVPDVLWGKIVMVVICESFAVFMGGGGLVRIKDGLKKDPLELGKYKMIPKGSISLFEEKDFDIAKTEYSYTILTSKQPLKWSYKDFHVTVYGRHGTIKKIELLPTKQRYSKGDAEIKEINTFLRKRLGAPSKKKLVEVEYYFQWGQIQSFYDESSHQAGIEILF